MRSASIAGSLALCLALAASAQESQGRWAVEGGQSPEVAFALQRTPSSYQGTTRHPQSGEARRLTLLFHGGKQWTLVVERPTSASGLAGALDGGPAGPGWGRPVLVPLKRGLLGGPLKGSGFKLDVPEPKPPAVPVPSIPAEERPVVRVLITGFDRFPTLQNHPTWRGTPEADRQPRTNPSGWAVRNFDPATLDPALTARVRVEVHALTDVPVLYVEGARAVCREIARVDADVAISFGVGSDGNADADVESECANTMDDCSEPFNQEPGPFQLPAAWPPAGSQSSWSDDDQAWLWRYPDNAGVSMNGQAIDPTQPGTLRSTLPVAKIVARVQREQLSAHDGSGGPGRYICNNVMFEVIKTQSARGRIGGFVHLAQWSDAKQKDYLTVVRCAIEESVAGWLERQP